MPREAPGRAGHERRRPSTAASRGYPELPETIQGKECPREPPVAEGIVGLGKPMLDINMVARVAPTRSRCWCTARPGPARSSWRAPSTGRAAAPSVLS